jgi:hypothetical protein
MPSILGPLTESQKIVTDHIRDDNTFCPVCGCVHEKEDENPAQASKVYKDLLV